MSKSKRDYRVIVRFKRSRSKKQPVYFIIKAASNGKILCKSENYTELRYAERAALLTAGASGDVLLEYEAGVPGKPVGISMPADLAGGV